MTFRLRDHGDPLERANAEWINYALKRPPRGEVSVFTDMLPAGGRLAPR